MYFCWTFTNNASFLPASTNVPQFYRTSCHITEILFESSWKVVKLIYFDQLKNYFL